MHHVAWIDLVPLSRIFRSKVAKQKHNNNFPYDIPVLLRIRTSRFAFLLSTAVSFGNHARIATFPNLCATFFQIVVASLHYFSFKQIVEFLHISPALSKVLNYPTTTIIRRAATQHPDTQRVPTRASHFLGVSILGQTSAFRYIRSVFVRQARCFFKMATLHLLALLLPVAFRIVADVTILGKIYEKFFQPATTQAAIRCWLELDTKRKQKYGKTQMLMVVGIICDKVQFSYKNEWPRKNAGHNVNPLGDSIYARLSPYSVCDRVNKMKFRQKWQPRGRTYYVISRHKLHLQPECNQCQNIRLSSFVPDVHCRQMLCWTYGSIYYPV